MADPCHSGDFHRRKALTAIAVAVCDENGVIVKFFTDFMTAWNWGLEHGYTNYELISNVELGGPIVNPAA